MKKLQITEKCIVIKDLLCIWDFSVLIEIKLVGNKLIEKGAENLTKIQNKINIKKMKKSAFLMVLMATSKCTYKRRDSVYVVPIGCLKN